MDNFNLLNLNPNISKAIALAGYTKPTPVQARSIPEILEGRDVVVSAQTGTGKTAAFVLPALEVLSSIEKMSKKPKVLILTPTRELASQITKAVDTYGKFLPSKVVSLVGGMPYHNQIKDLARGADIIAATPGRLIDHIESGRVDLSEIKMLVLDEADRMLDMGFTEAVQYIAKKTPSNRQTLLFSATVDKNLMHTVNHLLKNPIRIDLSDQKITAPQIKQEFYRVNSLQHKFDLLRHILKDGTIYKSIIFSATKINADRLANELRDEGFAAAALHGDLRQSVRNRTIEQLRNGKIQYLVATDVAARGIDMDISHVINFDLPKFCEDYVHRIGRTGRAGRSGIAISFILGSDTRHVQRIERYIGQRVKISHPNIPQGSTAAKEKDAYSMDRMDSTESYATEDTHKKSAHRNRGERERSSSFHKRGDERSSSFKHGADKHKKFGKKKFSSDTSANDRGHYSARSDERSGSFKHDADKHKTYGKKKFSSDTNSNERGSYFTKSDERSGSFKHGADKHKKFGKKPFSSDTNTSNERGGYFAKSDERSGSFKHGTDKHKGFGKKKFSSDTNERGHYAGKSDERSGSFKHDADKHKSYGKKKFSSDSNSNERGYYAAKKETTHTGRPKKFVFRPDSNKEGSPSSHHKKTDRHAPATSSKRPFTKKKWDDDARDSKAK